ncbi:hypothetical protein [Streptomyces sp. HD]|uniref:hypothetical protein n=1 Tax=Streptomyces sp. HD TaxID=3020892 RepID=UPI00232E5BB5|nr:hypothetical protein [Streptomyces sp. HD]MDC0772330.1 hypothetical protein [Streptomyces sp. HD]
MTLVPRAAVALFLGVAAAACTDDPEPRSPAPPTHSVTPTASSPAVPPAPTPTRTPTSTPATTTAASVPPAPDVLTHDDTGRTVTLSVGETTQLRFSGRWREATPAVDGTAIVLVPVDYESDPGFRAWDVRAAEPGEAVLHAAGPPGPVRIMFRVR